MKFKGQKCDLLVFEREKTKNQTKFTWKFPNVSNFILNILYIECMLSKYLRRGRIMRGINDKQYIHGS